MHKYGPCILHQQISKYLERKRKKNSPYYPSFTDEQAMNKHTGDVLTAPSSTERDTQRTMGTQPTWLPCSEVLKTNKQDHPSAH